MSRKAPFDQVKEDPKAVEFHVNRYKNGSVDALAKLCYQLTMQKKASEK